MIREPSGAVEGFGFDWSECTEPVFFVMAILGCGDGNAACSVARIEPTHYATAAQCRAEMTDVLALHTDLSFPVISAACRATGPMIVDATKGAERG